MISSRNQRIAPRRARTSAWLSCSASPVEGNRAVGRHLVPVAREIGLKGWVRKNAAATVYWEAGGVKEVAEKDSRIAAISKSTEVRSLITILAILEIFEVCDSFPAR